jgi:hypothetical protein
VIAVRNSAGQLVMESIVETKASSLLQFIHENTYSSSSCSGTRDRTAKM